MKAKINILGTLFLTALLTGLAIAATSNMTISAFAEPFIGSSLNFYYCLF